MTKRNKTWIIVGSVVGGLVLTFGAFMIYANSPISPFIARSGGVEKYNAKKIGKIAYQEEKKVEFFGHAFTFYNVKSDSEGNWILVDNTSYIVNLDIQFGFRFKNNDGLVKIAAYGDGKEPRDMGKYSKDPSYTSYQVDFGFKITVDESVNMSDCPNGFNLGIFEHWC